MDIKKSKSIEAYIPTSSMADIAFLLIIFFMVSSVFPLDKTGMELPTTWEVKDYPEDSAIIAITTTQLEQKREKKEENLADVDFNRDTVHIKVSDGLTPSQEIFTQPVSQWNMTDEVQFGTLRDLLENELVKKVDRRTEINLEEGKAPIAIVIKADAKVPYFAVDGVVQALQEIGGQASSRVAILSHLPAN